MKNKLVCSVLHLESAAKLVETVDPKLCLLLLQTAKAVAEKYCLTDSELEEAKNIVKEIKNEQSTEN